MQDIDPQILLAMQQRIGKRIFFFVPMCPKENSDGSGLYWGVAYDKSENKGGRGFIFGHLHHEFMAALSQRIRAFVRQFQPEKVLLCGYSMGGFGVWTLGAHAPDLFDAVVSAAGYGVGTKEPSDKGWGAPQPKSSEIFDAWLAEASVWLATIPVVMAIHAPADTISSYNDAALIIQAVSQRMERRPTGSRRGGAVMVTVPNDKANSDAKRRGRKKQCHSYFTHSLVSEDSVDEVWAPLLLLLLDAPDRSEIVQPTTPPTTPRRPGRAQAGRSFASEA